MPVEKQESTSAIERTVEKLPYAIGAISAVGLFTGFPVYVWVLLLWSFIGTLYALKDLPLEEPDN